MNVHATQSAPSFREFKATESCRRRGSFSAGPAAGVHMPHSAAEGRAVPRPCPLAQPEVYEHVLEILFELAGTPVTSDATLDLLRQVQLVPTFSWALWSPCLGSWAGKTVRLQCHLRTNARCSPCFDLLLSVAFVIFFTEPICSQFSEERLPMKRTDCRFRSFCSFRLETIISDLWIYT